MSDDESVPQNAYVFPTLKLPIPVYITRWKDGRKEAVWGTYRYADDPNAGAEKFQEPVVRKSKKVCHIFEFPPLRGEDHPIIFTRPTTAEQYVKSRKTGKGWTQVFTPLVDGNGIEYDVCLDLLRNTRDRPGPGFKNDESIGITQRNAWYAAARKVPSRCPALPNSNLPGLDLETIALAMVEAGIDIPDEKTNRFIQLLNHYKAS
jgi:hypothetical protein